MASVDTGSGSKAAPAVAKRRKAERACQACRHRKKRCDGAQPPSNRCSHCITYDFECVFTPASAKTHPPRRLGYVESLEDRVEKLEALLRKLRAEDGQSYDNDDVLSDASQSSPGPEHNATLQLTDGPKTLPPCGFGADLHEIARTSVRMDLASRLELIKDHPAHLRFTGESSNRKLIQTALDIHRQHAPQDKGEAINKSLLVRRPEYWRSPYWENQSFNASDKVASKSRRYTFPDADLLTSLVDLYFEYVNSYLAVLHRPTFEAALADQLHLRNEAFAIVVLLVCANAARHSDDPRAFVKAGEGQSAGWHYFNQVTLAHKAFLAVPSLHDVQSYGLAVFFLAGSSASQSAWTLAGIGIRMAQDVGAHRRNVYGEKPSIHDELWKRAFWGLIIYDRMISASLGRQCAILNEDFDIDLPTDCDDEYWSNEDTEEAFKQPPGVPSRTSFFIYMAKLSCLIGTALRSLYSVNSANTVLGAIHQNAEPQVVADLDSELNDLIDSTPDHLKWSEYIDNVLFYDQSATLFATYHWLRIFVHRQFIPAPRQTAPLRLPSLSICTHAARSCSNILDAQLRRRGKPNEYVLQPAFASGIVLMLSIWGSKRSGLSIDPVTQLDDASKCLKYLEALEPRLYLAGRLSDLIRGLGAVGDLPLVGLNGGEDYGPVSGHLVARIDDNDITYVTLVDNIRADAHEHDSGSESPASRGSPKRMPSTPNRNGAPLFDPASKGGSPDTDMDGSTSSYSTLEEPPALVADPAAFGLSQGHKPHALDSEVGAEMHVRSELFAQQQAVIMRMIKGELPNNLLAECAAPTGVGVVPHDGGTFAGVQEQQQAATGDAMDAAAHGHSEDYVLPVAMDVDPFAVWSNVPWGVEPDAWNSYMDALSGVQDFQAPAQWNGGFTGLS